MSGRSSREVLHEHGTHRLASLDHLRQRVVKGGHDIPGSVQERCFHAGIRNFAIEYRQVCDHWRLFDNTGEVPVLVAEEQGDRFVVVDAARLVLIERSANVNLMSDGDGTGVKEPCAMSPEENTRRAVRALRKAYADAVLENLRYGLPVIQWREDRVVEVPAEELAPRARRILAANGEPLPEEQ